MNQSKITTHKFSYATLLKLSNTLRLENITTGDCDFCNNKAAQGRKLEQDVFYICEHHKRVIEK